MIFVFQNCQMNETILEPIQWSNMFWSLRCKVYDIRNFDNWKCVLLLIMQHEMRLMRKLARHLCAMYKWQEMFSQTTSVVRHLQRTQIQLLWILLDFSKQLLPRPATFGFWLCKWVTCANSTTWFAKNGACNPTLSSRVISYLKEAVQVSDFKEPESDIDLLTFSGLKSSCVNNNSL